MAMNIRKNLKYLKAIAMAVVVTVAAMAVVVTVAIQKKKRKTMSILKLMILSKIILQQFYGVLIMN